MPRESGIELVEKVRAVNSTIQIIIMTGEPTVETAVQSVRTGANDYMIKPINKENLLRVVRHAWQIKSLIDEKNALEEQNLLYQKNLEAIIENRTNALQNAMQSIIYLLSSVVEVRDPYTAGHQRRVGNLSAEIAKKMQRDDKTVDFLRIIGYIHISAN
jgi:response regulator RpfG family c-di-GMP phosphodiesterase